MDASAALVQPVAVFSPILLYAGCALGAIGVAMSLPRRGVSPQVIGGLIGAGAFGLVMLALGLGGFEFLPNFNFYAFSFIALASALRVISHPRPVYSALFFVMTILASAGLYLLLSAEFMAFALIIVYAGAILITYLFVIMLATESPTEGDTESLNEYDRFSREPILATAMGFVLIAVLATMLGRGAGQLTVPSAYNESARLADLPGKVERALKAARKADGTTPIMAADETIARDESGALLLETRTGMERVVVKSESGATREIPGSEWPAGLVLENVEGVAFSLLADHPGSIEIAGVILLMAMLGAVVLARKKIEMDEAAKAAAARQLAGGRSA